MKTSGQQFNVGPIQVSVQPEGGNNSGHFEFVPEDGKENEEDCEDCDLFLENFTGRVTLKTLSGKTCIVKTVPLVDLRSPSPATVNNTKPQVPRTTSNTPSPFPNKKNGGMTNVIVLETPASEASPAIFSGSDKKSCESAGSIYAP